MIVLTIATAAFLTALLGAGFAAATDDPSQNALPPLATPSAYQAFGGGIWKAGVTSRRAGSTCVELQSPAGWRSGTCISKANAFSTAQVRVYSGGAGGVSFVYGLAAPGVSSVKLVHADCSTKTLSVAPNGVFLAISSSTAPAPAKIDALGAAGMPLGSSVLTADPRHQGARC